MIYVVGESRGRQPNGGTSLHLAQAIGISEDTLLNHVVWVNLFGGPTLDPSLMVRLVERSALPTDAVLLLGRRVQEAFALPGMDAFAFVARNAGRGPRFYAVPHPSGLNRWWNDPTHQAQASDALGAIWRAFHE